MWHGYFGIENIGLTAPQQQTLVQALRQLGPASDAQPARLCHWRIRSDNQAAIFEALFDDNVLTIAAWKQRLASIFGVDVALITHTATTQTFGSTPSNIVTFAYLGTSRLRVALFGGTTATWQQSRDETAAYLTTNRVAWES